MAFQKVLRVPDGILRVARDGMFLCESDLEKLSAENLLFFLRTSSYHILDDHPFMGNSECKLYCSKIEGPFEASPEIEQRRTSFSKSEKKALEVLVPVNVMPADFQPVTCIHYGTIIDKNTLRWGGVKRDGFNPERIWDIGNRILTYLQKKSDRIEQPSDSNCLTTIDGCLVEFNLAKSRNYPLMEIDIFGREETPLQLMRNLEAYEVEQQFLFYDRATAVRNVTRQGLAYHLSIDGKNIVDVLKSKNVIL